MTDELTAQNLTVKIKRLDPKAPGFLPMYRQLLSSKRAVMEFDKAQPEDVDQIYLLLEKHIIEPETPIEKRRFLDTISADDMGRIFDEIMGVHTVSPQKGAA